MHQPELGIRVGYCLPLNTENYREKNCLALFLQRHWTLNFIGIQSSLNRLVKTLSTFIIT